MSDPTIPRGGQSARAQSATSRTVHGVFVEQAGDVVLFDLAHRNRWPSSKVRIMSAAGGAQVIPRPRRYGAGSEILVEGDTVLITFLDNDPEKPVVLGTVRALAEDPNGYFDLQPLTTNPNRVASRLLQVDTAGKTTGFVDVEMFRQDDGRLEIRVGGSAFDAYTRIEVDGAAGTVKIGKGAEQPTILADDYLADLAGVLAELQATAAGIPLGTVVPTPNTAAMAAKLAAYKSAVAKVQ